jgi:ABC-2 type transport system ATP-binding protein
MSRAVGRIGFWLTTAAVAAALSPAVAPTDPTLHPTGDALVVGCAAGALAFVLLARSSIPVSAITVVPPRRLAARSVVLLAKSVQEEAIWRGLVLGLLVGPFGRLGALTLSTVAFATAHVTRQGRAAVAHLVTGTLFGLAYLVTGRLVAAVAAHGAYNVLVGVSGHARTGVTVSDTSPGAATLIASRPTFEQRRSMSAPPDASKAGTPVARLEGVVKSFGRVRALDGVDLELRSGEILALLGANGAGKSTAVAVMLGLRRADEGAASLFGLDPRIPRARRRVGAVLQDIGFPPGLRVREAVDLTRSHFPGAASTTFDALARLDLASLADREAGGLSGGQRRRLAVALALTGNPEVLFLDEPTAGMDASARHTLLSDLRGYAASGGAVLLTTQQLAEAEEIATRIVLLAHGRIVLTGSVPEVRARAGRARVTVRTAALPVLRGAAAIETQGDRHVVYVDDADAFVSELVLSGATFSELEVVPVSLEDAFVTLTAEAEP